MGTIGRLKQLSLLTTVFIVKHHISSERGAEKNKKKVQSVWYPFFHPRKWRKVSKNSHLPGPFFFGGSMMGVDQSNDFFSDPSLGHFSNEKSQKRAMKKTKAPNCFRGIHRGWHHPTQLYRGFFHKPWSIQIPSFNNQDSMESKYLCEMGDLPHPSQPHRRRRQPPWIFALRQERFLRQTILDHCPSFPAPCTTTSFAEIQSAGIQEGRSFPSLGHTQCQSQAVEPVPKTKTSPNGKEVPRMSPTNRSELNPGKVGVSGWICP